MDRRYFIGSLATAVLGVSAGCLSQGQGLGSDSSSTPTRDHETTIGSTPHRNSSADDGASGSKAPETTVEKHTENITATFRVQDGHWGTPAPTETADADWQAVDNQIEVTGTIITDGCHNVTFESITLMPENDSLKLVVGTELTNSAKNRELDCGQAARDYSIVLSVGGDLPGTITVTHQHEDDQTQTFTIDR